MTALEEIKRALEDLSALVGIVSDETGALKMSDADEDSVGWNESGPLPMTFGHVRRAHVALSTLESLQRENEDKSRDLSACQEQAVKDGNEISSLKAWQAGAISCREAEQARIDEYKARAEAAEAEVKRLTAKLAGCDWYWPEDDTSSDACANSQWEIAEIYDLKPADILAYSRGGIVETRYYAFLPPADDSDSDDNFEVDESTEEEVAAKITAEIERRTALASTGGEHHAE